LDDDNTYVSAAANIVDHGRLEIQGGLRVFRPPLYPFFLAAWMNVDREHFLMWSRVALMLLGLLVPVAVAAAATALTPRPVAVAAYLWSLFHLPFIHYTCSIQSDGLFLVMVAAAIATYYRRRSTAGAVLAGLFTGLAILGRAQFLVFAPLAVLGYFVSFPRKDAFRRSVVFSAGVFLCLAPWWIRNYRLFHTFVLLTTDGGQNLWLGNRAGADGGLDGTNAPDPSPKGLTELEWDRWNYREAIRYMRENPGITARMSLTKLGRFWALTPQVGGWKLKAVFLMVYAPLYAFGLYGLWTVRRRWRDWFPLVGLFAIYSAMYTILPTVIRHRLALEPVMIILASQGLVAAWVIRVGRRNDAV
jgi:hypothetical protein